MPPNMVFPRSSVVFPLVLVLTIAAAAGCGKKSEPAPESASPDPTSPIDPRPTSWYPSRPTSVTTPPAGPGTASATAPEPASPTANAAPTERLVPPLPPAEPPPRPVRIRAARNEPRPPASTDPSGLGSPPGLPPDAAAGAGAMLGQVMGSMEEVPERPGFPRWERLAPFEPDRLGAWTAAGPANGATAKAMGMTISTSSRSYAAGGRTARVSINAGDVVEMAAMELDLPVPDESTPEHVVRHVELGGHPAIVEWWKGRGTAEIRAVVASTYQVTVEIIPADGPEQALEVARALDLAGLARLR
ncbi:MAG: hypothetical protein HY905_07505 [Deltaproteobacteria bacterium]|nr:hypothetical protein [Deltaproteobacteria bacterium]